VGASVHFKAVVMPSLSMVKRSKKNAKIRVGVFFLDLFTLEDEGTTTLCTDGTTHPAAQHHILLLFYTHVPADCQRAFTARYYKWRTCLSW